MAGGFGSEFASRMALSTYRDGAWSAAEIRPLQDLIMHPGAHALHYGSSCFEGFKAYRQADGRVQVFRLDRHVERLRNSARLLCLPVPEADAATAMLRRLIDAVRAEVPEYPAALYLRPVIIGTEPNIGSAARPTREALFYVLASPVGDYFDPHKALSLWVEDRHMRTTPDFGQVKTGGNYAAALRRVVAARAEHAVDQILFCPGDDVQETAAANFLLLNDDAVVTKRIDGSILPGVTRASILELAADAGYRVEERDIGIAEMLEWVGTGEAALSGTAAVLAGVGTLVYGDREYPVNGGATGPHTLRLRDALMAIHAGTAPDRHGWLTEV